MAATELSQFALSASITASVIHGLCCAVTAAGLLKHFDSQVGEGIPSVRRTERKLAEASARERRSVRTTVQAGNAPDVSASFPNEVSPREQAGKYSSKTDSLQENITGNQASVIRRQTDIEPGIEITDQPDSRIVSVQGPLSSVPTTRPAGNVRSAPQNNHHGSLRHRLNIQSQQIRRLTRRLQSLEISLTHRNSPTDSTTLSAKLHEQKESASDAGMPSARQQTADRKTVFARPVKPPNAQATTNQFSTESSSTDQGVEKAERTGTATGSTECDPVLILGYRPRFLPVTELQRRIDVFLSQTTDFNGKTSRIHSDVGKGMLFVEHHQTVLRRIEELLTRLDQPFSASLELDVEVLALSQSRNFIHEWTSENSADPGSIHYAVMDSSVPARFQSGSTATAMRLIGSSTVRATESDALDLVILETAVPRKFVSLFRSWPAKSRSYRWRLRPRFDSTKRVQLELLCQLSECTTAEDGVVEQTILEIPEGRSAAIRIAGGSAIHKPVRWIDRLQGRTTSGPEMNAGIMDLLIVITPCIVPRNKQKPANSHRSSFTFAGTPSPIGHVTLAREHLQSGHPALAHLHFRAAVRQGFDSRKAPSLQAEIERRNQRHTGRQKSSFLVNHAIEFTLHGSNPARSAGHFEQTGIAANHESGQPQQFPGLNLHPQTDAAEQRRLGGRSGVRAGQKEGFFQQPIEHGGPDRNEEKP